MNNKENNMPYTVQNDGIKLNIRVIPNASKCEILDIIDNSLKVKLNVPPIEGKANKKCIEYFSKLLHVAKTSIEIISGEKSKNKVLYIKGNPERILEKLNL